MNLFSQFVTSGCPFVISQYYTCYPSLFLVVIDNSGSCYQPLVQFSKFILTFQLMLIQYFSSPVFTSWTTTSCYVYSLLNQPLAVLNLPLYQGAQIFLTSKYKSHVHVGLFFVNPYHQEYNFTDGQACIGLIRIF